MALSFIYSPILTSIPDYWKNHNSYQTFVDRVMSLLFNMLSRLVIAFCPRSKHLLISWLQSQSAVILEPPQNKVSHCFPCFPIYLPWSDGTRCHDLSFLNVELFFFNLSLFIYLFIYLFIVVVFVIHWPESAMDLHVFPILIPPPTSLNVEL